MAYEPQIIALANGAKKLHGELEEVLFLENDNKDSILVFADGTTLPVAHQRHGYNIRSEAYAFPVAAQLGGTDPFSLLTFGYWGTGPECYAAFLDACGFVDPNVKEIKAPLRLKADGKRVQGARLKAQWTEEVCAKSLDEARGRIVPPGSADSCILREEVLCDGTPASLVVTVETASASDAERTAKAKIPALSEVLSVEVADKRGAASEKILVFTEAEAMEGAKARIKNQETAYKTLAGVFCTRKPQKGVFGIGKAAGEWEAAMWLRQESKSTTVLRSFCAAAAEA